MSIPSFASFPRPGRAGLLLMLGWAVSTPLAASKDPHGSGHLSQPGLWDVLALEGEEPRPEGKRTAPVLPGNESGSEDEEPVNALDAPCWFRTSMAGSKPRFHKITGPEGTALDNLERISVARPRHAFFTRRGNERLGMVSRYRIDAGPGKRVQPPRELGADRDGLYWVCDEGAGYQLVSLAGIHHAVVNAPCRVKHMLETGGLAWFLWESMAMAVETPDKAVASARFARPLEKGSQPPVASQGGDLFVPMSEAILHLRLVGASPDVRPEIKIDLIPGTPETRNARLMTDPSGSVLVHAPDQPFLYVRRVGEAEGARFATADNGLPVCLAQGTGRKVWFIQTRPFGIGCIDTGTMRIEHLEPKGQAAPVREPHAAVIARDGTLWFTDRKGCQIGRVTLHDRPGEPAGTVTLFGLGKGQHPEEIVRSEDEEAPWLYFTLKDQAMVGSIWAVEDGPTGRRSSVIGSEWHDFVAGRPRANSDPHGASPGAERKTAPLVAGRLDLKTKVSAQGARPATAPAPSRPGTAGPAPAVPAPWTPEERLQLARLKAMRVKVKVGDIHHVLEGHGAHSAGDGSKLAPRFSNRLDLLRLLADGLTGKKVGGHGDGQDGSFRTLCTQPRVGVRNGRETDTFVVVTRREKGKGLGKPWHRLGTLFPH